MAADPPDMDPDLEKRIKRAVSEPAALAPANPEWPAWFDREAARLRELFPPRLIRRIEHFGSTAVPGLAAKPIIDMLVEVSSLEEAKRVIVPELTARGHEYFWRPEFDKPPMYAWFIRRNEKGDRTHHIHMVEADSKLWERLLFRDYLRKSPETAARYARIKMELERLHPKDRIAYTRGKT